MEVTRRRSFSSTIDDDRRYNAVVGGGIAGTLCSLVLKHRGIAPTLIDQGRQLGGRLCGGAQLLRAADPRLAAVYQMLAKEDLIQQWEGRFGVLGSSGGGFLSADVIPRRGPHATDASNNSGHLDRSVATDGGDFCHFVDGSTTPTYVGKLETLCSKIVDMSQIESVSNATLLGATPSPKGWSLKLKGQMENTDITNDTLFDGLVLATHDASLASGVVNSIVDAELAAGAPKEEPIVERLSHLAGDLQRVRDQGKMPVYTLRATFPEGFSSQLPFDAVTVPGSPYVQFLSRTGGDEVWTAVSTSRYALELLARPDLSDAKRVSEASTIMAEEVVRLFSHYATASPETVSAKRWGAAFTSTSLNLREDSIALQPWRLTVCGDFVHEMAEYSTPLEAAALSGLEAGERTAAYFAEPDQPPQ